MTFKRIDLTDKQRDALLRLEEGHFLDKKDIRIKPAKMSCSVSAFANSDGGDLYIGFTEIEDQVYQWSGLKNEEAANAFIQVLDSLFPLGHDYSMEFLAHPAETGLVLHISVRKTRNIVPSTDRTPYVRRGPQNLPVDTHEKRSQLERNKGIASFESETVAMPLDIITSSEVTLRFIQEVIPSSTPENWLRKQQVIQSEKPTVAGVLLFADLPQASLPKRSGIKISRYKTHAKIGTRDTLQGTPESVEGCVYDLIHSAVRRTQEIIASTQVLSSVGFERIEYPTETLHEVITNAVIHRDYAIADDVHVRIFDNRVEVESPGVLAGHVTVANILMESFRRNGNLVRLLNKFPNPPNKDIGEGLRTAFASMRKLRLRDPIIPQTDSTVIVEIRHERLASPEALVMEYLQEHNMITNREGRELCGIGSENSMKKVFNRLKERKQIERVPGMNGGKAAWRKTGNVERQSASLFTEADEKPLT